MKTSTIAAALLALAAACGGSDTDKSRKLEDEACACKDKACAEGVSKMQELPKELKEPSDPEGRRG